VIACTSRAAEDRLLGIPFASGRNESRTPAAMVAAAKISGSRNAAPAIRPELRTPGIALESPGPRDPASLLAVPRSLSTGQITRIR
jgi:hypothetical protein